MKKNVHSNVRIRNINKIEHLMLKNATVNANVINFESC